MNRLLELITILGVCLGVLSLEQTYGVPFITFFLILELSFRAHFWQRVGLWMTLGLSLAGMFNLPISWGIGCVFLVTGSYVLSEPALKSSHLRAIIVSLIGSLVIANLAEVAWSSLTLMTLGVSLVISIILARQFFWSREIKVV